MVTMSTRKLLGRTFPTQRRKKSQVLISACKSRPEIGFYTFCFSGGITEQINHGRGCQLGGKNISGLIIDDLEIGAVWLAVRAAEIWMQ